MKEQIKLNPFQQQVLDYFSNEEQWANCMIDAFVAKLKATDLQSKYRISEGVTILIFKLILKANDDNTTERLEDNKVPEWSRSSGIPGVE